MIQSGITTLYVRDLDRSLDFYVKTLRLRLRKRAGDTWAEVVAGRDLVLGLHRADPASASGPASGAIKIGLCVARPLDEAVEELEARGVEISERVDDDGPVRLAFFADPDGNPLYLFELVEAASPAS